MNESTKKFLRLSAFLLVVSGASAIWKVRSVAAEMSERSLAIGRQLDRLKQIAAGTSELSLNGQALSITSMSSPASVHALLDRFTRLCAENSGGVDDDLRALGKLRPLPAYLSNDAYGVFRVEKDSEGSAACFARPAEGGLRDLMQRAERLVASGDFAAFGELRVVFVRRQPSSNTSHVVTVSSRGSIPLAKMFPAQGDAPGLDVLDGVRPSASRRVVSAALEGSKQRTAIYESSLPPSAAVRSFDRPLMARGFEIGDLSGAGASLPVETRVYVKSDDIILVLADRRGDRSSVSAFRLANGGFVTMRP